MLLLVRTRGPAELVFSTSQKSTLASTTACPHITYHQQHCFLCLVSRYKELALSFLEMNGSVPKKLLFQNTPSELNFSQQVYEAQFKSRYNPLVQREYIPMCESRIAPFPFESTEDFLTKQG